MKKFILFFALFAMCLGVKAQWEEVEIHGINYPSYFNDICFCNTNDM